MMLYVKVSSRRRSDSSMVSHGILPRILPYKFDFYRKIYRISSVSIDFQQIFIVFLIKKLKNRWKYTLILCSGGILSIRRVVLGFLKVFSKNFKKIQKFSKKFFKIFWIRAAGPGRALKIFSQPGPARPARPGPGRAGRAGLRKNFQGPARPGGPDSKNFEKFFWKFLNFFEIFRKNLQKT